MDAGSYVFAMWRVACPRCGGEALYKPRRGYLTGWGVLECPTCGFRDVRFHVLWLADDLHEYYLVVSPGQYRRLLRRDRLLRRIIAAHLGFK